MSPPQDKPATRVLACIICQARKVRCDRQDPCSNCVKSGVECTRGPLAPRPRRRRFPERHLLERVRHYEDLLRQHKIKFEPLHPGREDDESCDTSPDMPGLTTEPDPAIVMPTEKPTFNDFWFAMNRWYRAAQGEEDVELPDEFGSKNMHEILFNQAWSNMSVANDLFLFGRRNPSVRLAQLHPPQAQIFKFWQIYLDNVNPLLKVTHAPSLQTRIIDAAANLENVDPPLEALMMSIYSAAAMTLTDESSKAMFGVPHKELVMSRQYACQQGILNCGVLFSSNRDCLTAFFLYLVSIRPYADPRSLSSMLGLVTRIAQRIGYHREALLARLTPFEAEMRRRVWWSLTMYDHRICELSDCKSSVLSPAWDCRMPRNVNDFDLREDMKTLPPESTSPTEAIFTISRSELGQFVRHSSLLLDMFHPGVRSYMAGSSSPRPISALEYDTTIDELDKKLQTGLFAMANLENPLHFAAVTMAKCQLAKYRLLRSLCKPFGDRATEKQERRALAFQNAIDMLKYDTALIRSPLITPFMWLMAMYYPLPAYMTIVPNLVAETGAAGAQQRWEAVSANYQARAECNSFTQALLFKPFSLMVLRAWQAYKAEAERQGHDVPFIVTHLSADASLQRDALAFSEADQQPHTSLPQPFSFGPAASTKSAAYVEPDAIAFSAFMDLDDFQVDWSNIDWDQIYPQVA